MPKITITDPTVGKFDMDWEGTSSPTDADIDKWISTHGLNKPKPQFPVTAPKDDGSLWGKLNRPMLPDIKAPGTLEAGDVTDQNLESFPMRATKEILSGAYKNLVQPATSAIGGAVTAATAAMGIPEVRPYVRPVARAGLALLTGKQAADTVPAVKEAWQNPTVNNVEQAALGTFGTLATGAGVAALKPGVKVPEGKLGNVAPETPEVKPPEAVTVPKDVIIKMRPGFENVLSVDEKARKIVVADPSKYFEGVQEVKGDDAQVKKFTKKLKAAIPSTDYNEGYNPDASVESNIQKPNDPQNAFADWVNARRAAKYTGQNAAEAFKTLDETYKGNDTEHPLVQLQQALKGGAEPELERYFNQLHEEVRKAGAEPKQLQLGYREDYLPQMWKNPPEEVNQVFSDKRLGTKPTFSLKALVRDYETGIKSGLEPKFDTPSQLIQSYAAYVDKFVADKNFFDQLQTNGILKTRETLGSDWKNYEALDPKRTPVQRYVTAVKGEPTEIHNTREYYVPRDIADQVNAYLKGDQTALGPILKYVQLSKELVLAEGIPGTGVNAHGFNILRQVAASKPEQTGRVSKWLIQPSEASKFMQDNLGEMPRAVRAGLMTDIEDINRRPTEFFTGGSKFADLGNKIVAKQREWFADPLMARVAPAVKLHFWKLYEDDFLKKGVDKATAEKRAADVTNEMFSGLNLNAEGRSKIKQNVFRLAALAPDWTESRVRQGKSMLQAFTTKANDPTYEPYRKVVQNVGIAYVAANVMNKATSGKWMWQNPDGYEFAVYLGKTANGKSRYLNPFGTTFDALTIPGQMLASAKSGNIGVFPRKVQDRLSTVAHPALNVLYNQDNMGRPLTGPRINVAAQAGNYGRQGMNMIMPPQVQNPYDFAVGNSSAEEAGARAVGMPFRYQKGPKVKSPF